MKKTIKLRYAKSKKADINQIQEIANLVLFSNSFLEELATMSKEGFFPIDAIQVSELALKLQNINDSISILLNKIDNSSMNMLNKD